MRLFNSIVNLLHFNQKNWKAVTLCILAAAIFWFFNALNKNYTTTISFPLEFDFDREDYMPVRPLEEELRINVTGMGWDIFRRTVGLRKSPLTIPLEHPETVKKIVGSTLPAFFSTQLEAFQINFVANDTVYIDVQPKGKRWITLSADSVYTLVNEDYEVVGDILIRPDSILVEGPVEMISKIKEPYTIQLNSESIDEDYNEEIEVGISNRNLITLTPEEVQVSFDVERFVQVTDTVKLDLINIPSSAQPKMDIQKLPATIRLRQDLVSSFPWDSVRAVVDLQSFNKGRIKVRPDLIGLPEYAELIKIDSIRIVY